MFLALWSNGFIGAKFGLPDADSLTFLSLRYAIVLVLMGALAWYQRAVWPPTAREWLHIGISGVLVHGVYLGGVVIAIGHCLPTLALTGLAAMATETMVVHWTQSFVFALGWLVLSLGAVSLLNVLSRSGSAVNVASLIYLVPTSTALVAWAFFGETPTDLALLGMVVTVMGVWLAHE